MRAIVTLCLAQIRREKLQKTLIVLILFLSVVLSTTALSVIQNTESLYTRMHGQLQGAHQVLQIDKGLHDPEEVHRWWQEQDGVDVSQIMPYQTVTDIETEKNTKILNYNAYMMRTQETPFEIDQLLVSEGERLEQPSEGCVWVPTAFSLPNQLHVGDILQFGRGDRKFSLRIEAIVIDISYCAPFSTTGRFFMNRMDYETCFADSEPDASMISLRFDDYAKNQDYWEQFRNDFGSPYLETITEFESLSSFYFLTNKLIGFIMLFLAVVMLSIAAFSIGYTISDSIITHYRTIGITQSLGFTAKKTILSYMLQYLLLSIVALIPAIPVSFFLSRFLAMNAFQYLQAPMLLEQFRFVDLAVGISILVPLLILLIVLVFTRKATTILPAQAIRYGMEEKAIGSKSAKPLPPESSPSLLGRIPLEISMAIRAIDKNRKSSILTLLLCTLTFSVLVFLTVFFSSVVRMQETIGDWGYDTSDAVIAAADAGIVDRQFLQQELSNESTVEHYNFYGDLNVIVAGEEDVPPMGMVLSVVQGSYDEIGFTTLEGRNARERNEIAIGINLANRYGKAIGDTIDLYMNGKKVTFLVTGTYQAIANMAFSARITSGGLEGVYPEFDSYTTVFIKMKDSANADAFVERWNQQFGGSSNAISSRDLNGGVIHEAVSILTLPVLIMSLILLLVIFVILYCMGSIMTKKHRKTYGIYKSLGMTSTKIRQSISLRTFLLACISMGLGVVAGTILIPKLINLVLANYGIIHMPIAYSYWMVLAVAIIGALTATWGSWASAGTVKKLSPKILIIE